MKYFIISIDDGTIYDRQVIDILNRYHIKATFNLNSGLDDFVWYLEDRPIERLTLKENVKLYEGHEVASHSLTHPHLTMCPDEVVYNEVNLDIENLENTFNRKIKTFAFPFEDFDDRCINIIKNIRDIECIRLSYIDTSYRFPYDQYHIGITSLDINDALWRLDGFNNDPNSELFVFVSHAYDFEVNNTYDKLELLCQRLKQCEDIQIITMNELPEIMKKA